MHRNLLLALALLAALPLAAQETADQDGRYLIQFRQFGGAAAAVRAELQRMRQPVGPEIDGFLNSLAA